MAPVPVTKAHEYIKELEPTLKGPLSTVRLQAIQADCWATLAKVTLSQKAELHHIRGACLYELGEFQDAFFHFSSAYQIKPTLTVACLNTALALIQLGRFHEALDWISRTTDQEIDLATLTALSTVLTQLEQTEDARAALEASANMARTAMDHFRVAVVAADLDLHVDACEMFARALAIELHKPLGNVNALEFISNAPEALKGCLRYRGTENLSKSIEEMVVNGSEILRHHEILKAISIGSDSFSQAQTHAAIEVFEWMAPYRARANDAVLGVNADEQI